MIDVGIFGDIAWDQQRIASESACQFFHIFFKPLALIRERQLRAGLSPGLRNRPGEDRKSTRLNSSHVEISYAVFCLKKKKNIRNTATPGPNHNCPQPRAY